MKEKDYGGQLASDSPRAIRSALSQEMTDAFHLNQTGGHHRDPGPGGKVVPGLLNLRKAELRGVELENVILPVTSCRCLAGKDVPPFVHS